MNEYDLAIFANQGTVHEKRVQVGNKSTAQSV
jgi:hypothetical protein